MADETSTTGPADASKKGDTSPASNPVEEARIIEEVVVKPAAKPVPAPIPVTAPQVEKKPEAAPTPQAPIPAPVEKKRGPPTPLPVVQPLPPRVEPPILPVPTSKPIAPPILNIPVPQVRPGPIPPAPLPKPLTIIKSESPTATPLSPTAAPQVPVRPITPISTQPPIMPSIPKAAASPEEISQKAREDIANILKETRLPERRASTPSVEEPKGKVFDTALGATAAALEEKVQGSVPVPSASTPPTPSPLATSIVSPFRTLKRDLQNLIQVNKISLVRAAALEQEKKRGAADVGQNTNTKSRRTFGILFTAALLILLGAGALFGVYIVMQGSSGGPQTPASSIVFAESTLGLPLGNESALELKRILAQAREAGGGTLGSITRLVPIITATDAEGNPTERPATLEEFLQALGTRTSGDLTRALSGEFFFGIHTVDENAPLFVIPVLSYERAFAGMLAWEQNMNADLAPAFTQVPVQKIGAGGLPEKRFFEDVVMRNYDVRALKDDAGEIQLYYSFPTRSLLVISESPYSFTEILSRLRAERKL